MPNWCYMQITINGDGTKDLDKVYNSIPEVSTVENGFGSGWLGDLVIALGKDYKEIRCRGAIEDYFYSEKDEQITIYCYHAWEPCYELMKIIKETFNVEVIYVAYDEFFAFAVTNDEEESKSAYIIYDCNNKSFCDRVYDTEEEEFCNVISEGKCKTYEQLEDYAKENLDDFEIIRLEFEQII